MDRARPHQRIRPDQRSDRRRPRASPQRTGRRLITTIAIAAVISAAAAAWLRPSPGHRPAHTADTHTAGAHAARTARPAPPPPTHAARAPAPRSGPGTFRYQTGTGPILGRAGVLRRFRVAIESNLTLVDLAGFAATLNQVLGDPRSWIASGQVRWQQVPAAAPAQFTVYLATDATSATLCATGGAGNTMEYTSCRYPGHVILNADRWLTSVPYYTHDNAPLPTYRAYMINHEVGHELGHGHELCPRSGQPAPVMQQQTLGLHGCTPNPWPYLRGVRYTGPPAPH